MVPDYHCRPVTRPASGLIDERAFRTSLGGGSHRDLLAGLRVRRALATVPVGLYNGPGFSLIAGPIFPAVLAQAARDPRGVMITHEQRSGAGWTVAVSFLAGVPTRDLRCQYLTQTSLPVASGGAAGGVIVAAAGRPLPHPGIPADQRKPGLAFIGSVSRRRLPRPRRRVLGPGRGESDRRRAGRRRAHRSRHR